MVIYLCLIGAVFGRDTPRNLVLTEPTPGQCSNDCFGSNVVNSDPYVRLFEKYANGAVIDTKINNDCGTLGMVNPISLDKCKELCQEIAECHYISLGATNGDCILTKTCHAMNNAMYGGYTTHQIRKH